MTGAETSGTRVAPQETSPPKDGQTLLFLAAAFECVIVAEYRQVLASKLSRLEAHIWEIDRALTACPKCHAMDRLADIVQKLHDSLADVAAAAGCRAPAPGADAEEQRTLE